MTDALLAAVLEIAEAEEERLPARALVVRDVLPQAARHVREQPTPHHHVVHGVQGDPDALLERRVQHLAHEVAALGLAPCALRRAEEPRLRLAQLVGQAARLRGFRHSDAPNI